MTIPSERRRALRWARATLEDIHSDPGASAEVKAEAAAVLAAFPDDRAVATCFLEQDDDNLARQLVAIEAAQEVLWRASRCPELSEQNRLASEATCCIPCDHVPIRSWPLFKARDVMRGVIESSKAESTQ